MSSGIQRSVFSNVVSKRGVMTACALAALSSAAPLAKAAVDGTLTVGPAPGTFAVIQSPVLNLSPIFSGTINPIVSTFKPITPTLNIINVGTSPVGSVGGLVTSSSGASGGTLISGETMYNGPVGGSILGFTGASSTLSFNSGSTTLLNSSFGGAQPAVPEPVSLSLPGLGAVGLLKRRRKA